MGKDDGMIIEAGRSSGGQSDLGGGHGLRKKMVIDGDG